jgi:hypothetical protein
MITPKNRGGARPGSGRKPRFEQLLKKTVSLPPECIRFLESLGHGNLSAGIRRLVEDVQNSNEPTATNRR